MKPTKIKLITVLFCLATLGSLLPSPALAYNYSGYCWPTNTVYFTVDPSMDLDPWRYGIAGAAGGWNGCRSTFNFYYDSNSSNLWYTGWWGPFALASTYVVPSGNTIVDCDTEFNTYYTWTYGGGGGTYDTWTVAMHEFGHWLCLYHNDSNTNIVMYSGYTGVKRSLHSDDVAGIVAIYGD